MREIPFINGAFLKCVFVNVSKGDLHLLYSNNGVGNYDINIPSGYNTYYLIINPDGGDDDNHISSYAGTNIGHLGTHAGGLYVQKVNQGTIHIPYNHHSNTWPMLVLLYGLK